MKKRQSWQSLSRPKLGRKSMILQNLSILNSLPETRMNTAALATAMKVAYSKSMMLQPSRQSLSRQMKVRQFNFCRKKNNYSITHIMKKIRSRRDSTQDIREGTVMGKEA